MLKRFAKDERGNFAIFTGLLATVMIGAMGGVLDLSMQWNDQAVVQRAADAAALAGSKALESGTEADALAAIQLVGHANIPDDFPTVSFVAKVDQAAGTVTVNGSGEIKPYFLGLLKINELSIASSAQSLIQRKSYIDFYFMLDVSESMNIAASEADRVKLENYTRSQGTDACAFACHLRNDGVRPKRSWYKMSQEAGVKLRIDVLREASKGMVDKILDLNDQPGSLKSTRIATAGFNRDFINGTAATASRSVAKASIDRLSTTVEPFSSDLQHTNIRYAMAEWRTEHLKAQGKGTGTSDIKKYAILVTDGVRDDRGDFNPTGLGPIEPALCEAIKSMGIELAVLEIKYIANPGERFFNERVRSYYNQISPNMQSCASPGLYYLAQDSGEAQTQLFKLLDAILTVRRRLSS